MKVKELDKYLSNYEIPAVAGMHKIDKVEAVRCHYYQSKESESDLSSDDSDSENDDTASSNSDEVEGEMGLMMMMMMTMPCLYTQDLEGELPLGNQKFK